MPSFPSFHAMIAAILPSVSDQEDFFAAYQRRLKKSFSQVLHKQYILPDYRTIKPSPFTYLTAQYIDRVDTSIALGKTRQHQCGLIYIQEIAASIPASIARTFFSELYAQTHKPLRVLDVCAAPGGKSMQCATALLELDIPGLVRGNDVDTKRLYTRQDNISRCGCYNTISTCIDGARLGDLYPQFFDCILVDAPCSGEGTGFKSDAAFKRRKQESINSIVGLQKSILASSRQALRPGGILIYSTCTINPFENELQLTNWLDIYGHEIEQIDITGHGGSSGITHVGGDQIISSDLARQVIRCRPHVEQTGGFFVSAFRKTLGANPSQSSLYQGRGDNTKKSKQTASGYKKYIYHKQLQKSMRRLCRDIYGIMLTDAQRDRDYLFVQLDKDVYIVHPSIVSLMDMDIYIRTTGIQCMTQISHGYKLDHGFASVLGYLATSCIYMIDESEAQRYTQGESLTVSDMSFVSSLSKETTNMVILRVGTIAIGVGKYVTGEIKNKFPVW